MSRAAAAGSSSAHDAPTTKAPKQTHREAPVAIVAIVAAAAAAAATRVSRLLLRRPFQETLPSGPFAPREGHCSTSSVAEGVGRRQANQTRAAIPWLLHALGPWKPGSHQIIRAARYSCVSLVLLPAVARLGTRQTWSFFATKRLGGEEGLFLYCCAGVLVPRLLAFTPPAAGENYLFTFVSARICSVLRSPIIIT